MRAPPALPPEKPFDWHGFATELAASAGMAERIRARHQPDATGHCTECRQQQNCCAPRHPCSLHLLAGMAIEIRRNRTS